MKDDTMLTELDGYDPEDFRPAFGPGCLVGMVAIAVPWVITAAIVWFGFLR